MIDLNNSCVINQKVGNCAGHLQRPDVVPVVPPASLLDIGLGAPIWRVKSGGE